MEHALSTPEPSANNAPHSADPRALADAWAALIEAEPRLRIRDAAARLGVSEAALRATQCGGAVTRLVDDWRGILCRLPLLGEVMALTRNEAAVHEKTGEYVAPQFGGGHGLVLGTAIDLRLFLKQWAFGFALAEDSRTSLHFFDAHGDAVHKIYTREGTDLGELRKLISIYADEPQTRVATTPRPAKDPPRADAEIDADGLRRAWLGMQDTHEFFGVLREHGAGRVQALRLAPPGYARRVDPASLDVALYGAAASALPIMVFVGNPGCIQIHTGKVSRIVPMGPWINVLDPGFNLHLRRDHIDQAWVVRKPTADGIVTSLELFDASGETIAYVFGERKPGRPELTAWRELTESFSDLPPTSASVSVSESVSEEEK
jgi:putative hemin transport protein